MKPAWLLLGVLLLDVRSVAAEETCTTSGCHASLLSKPHVHPPADSCDSCHEAVSPEHPQKGRQTFKLTQPTAELCAACHDPFKKAHVHGPVSTGECTACHDPHASVNEHLLVRKDDALCEGCHADVAEQRKKPHVHGALEGGCVSCHDPHASDHPRLLADEVPALCLTCHDTIAEKVAAPVAHPALSDPRACIACHLPHASEEPKLLAAGFRTTPYVPYTESEYALCFGCHPGS